MTELSFVVYGIPRPQGSLRPVTNRKTGKTLLVPQLKGVEAWKEQIAKEAWAVRPSAWPAGKGCPYLSPIELVVSFHLPKPDKPAHAWPRQDLDKLVRAVCDALTLVLYSDDSQIISLVASKNYAVDSQNEWSGAAIRVKALA